MGESESISERGTTSVAPLILNRQAIAVILVVGILFWISAIALWVQADLDKWLLISHNGLRTNELVVRLAKGTSGYGMSVIVLVYLVYLLFGFKYEKLRDANRIYLLVFFMFGIAGIGGDILKEIIDRPRPFVEYAGELIAFSTANTPALPSGHATKSMALALPFLLMAAARDRWQVGVKIFLAVTALGVCYSRVLLGAHYVSDVLAGIGTALICLPLVTPLVNKILGRMKKKDFDRAVRIWAVVLVGLLIYLIVM
jgi:undecaprenyl-diphosphatase